MPGYLLPQQPHARLHTPAAKLLAVRVLRSCRFALSKLTVSHVFVLRAPQQRRRTSSSSSPSFIKMSKDAPKIQCDDHCCCLAQNNKNNGPKRRDSVQEAINAGSSLSGCCGLQGCECCGLCYPSMQEKDGDMALYGTTPCLKTFCTMVKVHYTKDTVKKCTPYTNPVEWPGWLKFCCTTGSANMFSVAAGMLDGALILYKGSWIKQGCRSCGCCGLKGCCFGGYKCMCAMATMGSLELGEECFEDTDCVPPAMNPKSLMWDIEDDAAIGAKLVRRNSISNASETGRSDANDEKVKPKYGAPFGKRRTGKCALHQKRRATTPQKCRSSCGGAHHGSFLAITTETMPQLIKCVLGVHVPNLGIY